MPQKTWAVGEEVLAADFNTYLQNQVVPVFTSTAQRDSQWPSPPDGAHCVVIASGISTLYRRIAGVWYTPHAVLTYVDRQTNAGPQGAEAVFMNTVAITIPANRRIVVETGFQGINSGANLNAFYRVRLGTTTAGTLLMAMQVPANATGAGNGGVLARPLNNPASPLQVCVTLEGQSTTATLQASATSPCWLQVRDVGGI